MEIDAETWCIPSLGENEKLEPPPEELEAMYRILESGGSLELSWKSPGRRAPSPIVKVEAQVSESANEEA